MCIKLSRVGRATFSKVHLKEKFHQ
uniref:Uncharacterized protein n=1 Tax=Arundo donax TaxID=35708 RepID=A0A0A9HNF8_ARUDO